MNRYSVYKNGRKVGSVRAKDYDDAKDKALARFGHGAKVR